MRKSEIIESEMIKLHKEFKEAREAEGRPIDGMEIDPDFLSLFNGRLYYRDWMGKLVWEEDE